MSRYLIVLPSIAPDWTRECLQDLRVGAEDLLVVDNTQRNRGVAASWNLGVTQVVNEQRDWLILLSAGVRFGAAGGEDFFAALDEHRDAACVEAADDIGWHLLAISRRALETVGSFDENFYPAYFEDNDWGYRFRLSYGLIDPSVASWPKVPIDARLEALSHGVDVGGARIPWSRLREFYYNKWGGLSPHETYTTPFNDPTKDLTWWPRWPDPRSILGQGPDGSSR